MKIYTNMCIHNASILVIKVIRFHNVSQMSMRQFGALSDVLYMATGCLRRSTCDEGGRETAGLVRPFKLWCQFDLRSATGAAA